MKDCLTCRLLLLWQDLLKEPAVELKSILNTLVKVFSTFYFATFELFNFLSVKVNILINYKFHEVVSMHISR